MRNRAVSVAQTKALKIFQPFLRFWKKDPLTVKFSVDLILFGMYSSPHRQCALCSNFVKFGRRKIDKILRYIRLYSPEW